MPTGSSTVTPHQATYLKLMVELSRTPMPDTPFGKPAENEAQRARRLAYEAGRIAAADASIAAGRVVSFEAICAWADSIDTPDEWPQRGLSGGVPG